MEAGPLAAHGRRSPPRPRDAWGRHSGSRRQETPGRGGGRGGHPLPSPRTVLASMRATRRERPPPRSPHPWGTGSESSVLSPRPAQAEGEPAGTGPPGFARQRLRSPGTAIRTEAAWMRAGRHPASPRGGLRGPPPHRTTSALAGRGRAAVSRQSRPFRCRRTGSRAAPGRRGDASDWTALREGRSQERPGVGPHARRRPSEDPRPSWSPPACAQRPPRAPSPGLRQLPPPPGALRFSPFSLDGAASLCPGGAVSVTPGSIPQGHGGPRAPPLPVARLRSRGVLWRGPGAPRCSPRSVQVRLFIPREVPRSWNPGLTPLRIRAPTSAAPKRDRGWCG